MKYIVKRYDVSADDKLVEVNPGDIIIGFDETRNEYIVLKRNTQR